MARQKGRMRRELRPIYLAAMAGLAASGGAHAQEAIFADDFSVDSLRWVTQSFDGSGPTSARGESGAVVLEASATNSGDANRALELLESTDSLSVTATIDPSTDFGGLAD